MGKVDETIGPQEPGLPREKFELQNRTLPWLWLNHLPFILSEFITVKHAGTKPKTQVYKAMSKWEQTRKQAVPAYAHVSHRQPSYVPSSAKLPRQWASSHFTNPGKNTWLALQIRWVDRETEALNQKPEKIEKGPEFHVGLETTIQTS